MGNSDAPKAPSGWYPIEEGKPGERYWDGSSWTGEVRGIPKPSRSNKPVISQKVKQKLTPKKWVFVGVSVFIIAALIAAIGFSSQKQLSPEVAMPDVVGISEKEAVAQLESSGLQVILLSLADSEVEVDFVIKTSPKAGKVIKRNSSVRVWISIGTPKAATAEGEGLSFCDWSCQEGEEQPQNTTGWAPAGYTSYSTELAYQWVSNGPDPCGSISCNYFTMNVTPHFGCPNGVYVEINISSGGVVVDWSNDTVPALAAGQTAQLQFITYKDNVDSGQVATMSCR